MNTKIPARKKRWIIILLILGTIIGLVFYFFHPYRWFLENHYARVYDYKNPQLPVSGYADIEEQLKRFEISPYSTIDTNYLHYSKSDQKKYKELLQTKRYYKIKGEDIFLFLVGTFRVKDFLAKDEYYFENLTHLQENKTQYLLIDKKLLFALLDLQKELEKKGCDPNGFTINYAHRHPLLNGEVGGASVSYHIRGQAIDLVILDINKDDVPTREDKQIVLDILESTIIGNNGGIGRYPWSMVVHFDVRGYKARWDYQK